MDVQDYPVAGVGPGEVDLDAATELGLVDESDVQ